MEKFEGCSNGGGDPDVGVGDPEDRHRERLLKVGKKLDQWNPELAAQAYGKKRRNVRVRVAKVRVKHLRVS